jgi:Tol biopolymer transport system component
MNAHRITVAIALLVATIVSAAHAQQTAEELYQSALYQEEVQGNLERAIDVYRQILEDFSDNRTVGAKALLHIGLCYEKLGLREAQQAYQGVISNYPEAAQEVAVARQRLASLTRALAELEREPRFRKIRIASKPRNGVLSPDGSKLAFTSEGSVWVVPIQGNVGPDIAGEPVRLTDPMGARNTGNLGLSWSADGEWIAFNAMQDEEQLIYVVPAAGGEPTMIPGNHFRGAYALSYRLGLSPDGKTLAFAYDDSDAEVEGEVSPYSQVYLSIYITPVEGGQPTKLTPIWSIEPAFSPDGRFVAYLKFARAEDEDLGDGYGWYRELWVIPAAGGTPVRLADSIAASGPVWSPDSRMIAFIREPGAENESQEIWVLPVSEGGAAAAAPLKIPLPRESQHPLAGWTPSNELGVFMNTPYHQAVYTVPAEGGKAVQISPDGLAFHPRWTPDGKTIVYRGGNRFSLAAVPAEGGEATEIPIVSDPEITPGIPGGGEHVSPDGQKIVFMGATRQPLRVNIFTVPIEGGAPTQLTETVSVPEMDTQDRYPCWSPDGDRVAFIRYRADHQAAKGDFSMNIYTVSAEGGEPRAITTDADSVAWAAIAYSPDGKWLAYFSNDAIKIRPVEGGEARVVVELETVDFHSELAWSPDSKRIAFTGQGSIWTVPIDGGEPVEVETGVLTEDAQNLHIDWSPDGKKIVFAASTGGEPELWLISDFLP